MSNLTRVIAPGMEDLLVRYMTSDEARNLCLALPYQEHWRFMGAVYRNCRVTLWNCYGHIDEFVRYQHVLVDDMMLEDYDAQLLFTQQLQFESVKIHAFSSDLSSSEPPPLHLWCVRSLSICSDYVVPTTWPKDLVHLKIRLCPRTIFRMACPDGVQRLTLIVYGVPDYSNLIITAVPTSLKRLQIDDYSVGWPAPFFATLPLQCLNMRLGSLAIDARGFPSTLRILRLSIARGYPFVDAALAHAAALAELTELHVVIHGSIPLLRMQLPPRLTLFVFEAAFVDRLVAVVPRGSAPRSVRVSSRINFALEAG